MSRSPIPAAGAAPAAETTFGMALMVGAMILVPGLDTLAKLLVERLSPAQVAAGRFLMQSLILLPILLVVAPIGPPTRLHLLAGTLLGLALLCLNTALTVLPVATAIAIFFVEPLILTLLAALLLGERLGWRRLGAVGVGLIGAMMVLRPNLAAYGAAAAWPLATAVLFAGYMLTTRVMTRRGSRLALQFWLGAVAALVLSLAAGGAALADPGGGVLLWPTGREMALFAAMGLLAALAHGMIIAAVARVEAGVVAPFQYLEILSATALGWLVFGDFPDAATWAGTGLIVSAGVYVFHRERQLARRAAPPAMPRS